MARPRITPSFKAALEDYLDRMQATSTATPRNLGQFSLDLRPSVKKSLKREFLNNWKNSR
jgi:hypothetical protein